MSDATAMGSLLLLPSPIGCNKETEALRGQQFIHRGDLLSTENP
jgi:hypothetical protein